MICEALICAKHNLFRTLGPISTNARNAGPISTNLGPSHTSEKVAYFSVSGTVLFIQEFIDVYKVSCKAPNMYLFICLNRPAPSFRNTILLNENYNVFIFSIVKVTITEQFSIFKVVLKNCA